MYSLKKLLEKLLDDFEKDLNSSLEKLKNMHAINKYHLEMCIKLCEMQLKIIKRNFEILNNAELWSFLF